MKTALALLVLAPGLALAQAPDESDFASQRGWTVGAAVAASDSSYIGEGARLQPFPTVIYQGERVFFRGTSGGVHLVNTGTVQVDAVVSARLDGFDIDDLSASGLAANGLDARLLDDRRHGLDVGAGLAWSGDWGRLRLQALTDVTGASGGQELGLEYTLMLKTGAWTFLPNAGVRWMSGDLTRYYFGTLESEVARGVPRYTPGSAVVPSVGVAALRPLGARWSFVGGLSYHLLPDALTDSPLLERGTNGVPSVFGGLSYRF